MRPFAYTFKKAEQEKVVIILDGSESAEKDWSAIVNCAKKIFQLLPADIPKTLYFLGNSKEYDIDKFENEVGVWRKENMKRGSFIAPILSKEQKGRIVVLGSGRIYDLEDWAEAEVVNNMLFLITSESVRGGLEIGNEMTIDACDLQSSLLAPKILSVIIRGTHFMPIYWDNPSYQPVFEGDPVLTGSKLQDYSVKVIAYGERIEASLRTAEGNLFVSLDPKEDETVDVCCLIEADGSSWTKLGDEEAALFHRHLETNLFTCPFCGIQLGHTLRCLGREHGALLGKSIYPSIKEVNTFIVLKDTSDGLFYKPYFPTIIEIGEERVARSRKIQAEILSFDVKSGQWIGDEILSLYYKLGDEYYVSLI